jgi:flagellar motility protein MotE (MotC chaperone)
LEAFEKGKNLALILPLFLILTLPVGVYASVEYVKITPENPIQGDVVSITVKASPFEEVQVTVLFSKTLEASGGEYTWRLNGVRIPSTPNTFEVRAENVRNLHVAVKVLLIWVTKSVDAKGGVASMSQSDVPVGTYDVVIYGETLDKTSKVTITVTASAAITMNRNGLYTYSLDTSSIPVGTFTVRIGEVEKTITLSPSKPETPEQTPTPQLIELMSDGEAAETLEKLSLEEAVAILEEVSNQKVARILQLTDTARAVEVLKRLTVSKAANVMVEIELGKASEIVEKMAEIDIKAAARILEETASINLTKTAEILENTQTTTTAKLILEIAKLQPY